MTNDTNTLNGALQELGETMADNLTTMGVPSTYDEGLTTLAGKILQISPVPPTPGPASIDLTATASILSYADGDSTVLTATVLDSNDDPVENATVELYKAGVLWDTLTTDSSGECSKTYTSAGVGDLTFEAKCNLLTKTYVVEDCTYYNPSTVTTTTTVSISLPTDVEVSFKVKRTSSSNNYSYIEIGGNSGNTALMGQVGGAGVSQFRTYVSEGSSTIDTTHDTSNVPSNTETLLVWTKNGTSQSYSTADSKVTWTDSHTHSKIRKLTISNNRIQELKVKPL